MFNSCARCRLYVANPPPLGPVPRPARRSDRGSASVVRCGGARRPSSSSSAPSAITCGARVAELYTALPGCWAGCRCIGGRCCRLVAAEEVHNSRISTNSRTLCEAAPSVVPVRRRFGGIQAPLSSGCRRPRGGCSPHAAALPRAMLRTGQPDPRALPVAMSDCPSLLLMPVPSRRRRVLWHPSSYQY